MVRRRPRQRHVFFCCVVVLFFFLSIEVEARRGETIRVVPASQHESGPGAGPLPVGPWPFGGSKEEDREFFAVEDARYAAWDEWRALLLQEEETAKKQKTSGTASDSGQNSSSPFVAKLALKSKYVGRENLSDRQMARRKMGFLRLVTNNSTELDTKLITFKKLTSQLFDLLQPDKVFTTESLRDTTSLEFHYTRLLTHAFSHTVVPPVLRSGVSLLPRMDVLPPLVLMDPFVIESMEKEVQALRYNLKMVLVAPSKKIERNDSQEAVSLVERHNTVKQINLEIDQMEQIIKDSRRALTVVQLTSAPLLTSLKHYLEKTITLKDQQILYNDQATEAKRQEAKGLTKAKQSLLAIQHRLILVTKDHTNAVYRDTLISAHSFIFGLALIAKYRLNVPSGFDDLDSLSDIDDNIPMLGALQEEFYFYILKPMGFAVCISVLVVVLVCEIRRYALLQAVQSNAKMEKPVDRQTLRQQMRFILRLLWLVQALLLTILPPGIAYYQTRDSPLKWLDAIGITLTAQRVALLIVLAVLYIMDFTILLVVGKIHEAFRPGPRVITRSKRNTQHREKKES